MKSTFFFRGIILFCCWGIDGVKGAIDWESIPEGILFGPGVGNVEETDFCGVVRDKSLELNDALRGRNLSVAVQFGPGFDFFQYDPDEELSYSNPGGMVASVLDQLAARAGFSWRNSFVAYTTNTTNVLFGKGIGKWDRMLNWTTSNFDLSVDKWFLTTARLESEIVFLHSWFDATLILVDQGDRTKLNWLSWTLPFDPSVWVGIVLTIVFSAIFMIFIEYMERARDNRSWKTWIGDHLYLSNLTFTQNFTYEKPRSGAGRIFLSTFSFWSMLIGATYTANLASLLVENALSSEINSIKAAMDAQIPICVHDGSASHTIVTTMYPAIKTYDKLVKTSTPTQMYDYLRSGKCDILVGTRQEFEILKVQEKYGCNLVQAGPEIHSGSASFAIKFDPLSCDSVLAYVLNIHLHAMSIDGNMSKYWDGYINGIDGTCVNKEELQQRRLLDMEESGSIQDEDELGLTSQRRLIGGASGEASGGSQFGADGEAQVLEIEGMAGIFMIHGFGTIVALVMVFYTQYRRKFIKAPKLRRREQQSRLEREKFVSERKMDPELHRRYQDLKTQLDNLFEEHVESRQGSHHHKSPYYEHESATDEASTEDSFSPPVVSPDVGLVSSIRSSANTSRFGMDGAIITTLSGNEAKAEAKAYHRSTRNLADVSEISMTGDAIHTMRSGRLAKMEAKAYHRSSRNIVSQNVESSSPGVIQTMGSGRLAKMEAKAYHRSSRNLVSQNVESSSPGVIQTMGSGRAAMKEAKAYHQQSRRGNLGVGETAVETTQAYQREILREPDVSESNHGAVIE